ncbi:hypothetical protein PPERSA_04312 [Pseudocohnilembus persalinus]|uniref:Transmembrane protein n=1 Tax=Pseudocohnilembus persalinus TaxID=266149 RepID=A0A0V0QQL2_PSEPJ|nr:hypothetical protein PPERSA_04312 [Pseudocohnilembus persalinus]|eukprot:KRX04497.1 hypothetical protein PPERSA_04312 [Pseudocohnilembus persalinus]
MYRKVEDEEIDTFGIQNQNTTIISKSGIEKQFPGSEDQNCSLMMNPKVKFFLKVMVPLAIAANLAIFIISTIGYVANLVGNGKISVVTIHDKIFNSLDLWGTATDMWDAGVYLLALSLMFTAGILPYINILIQVICWVLPYKTEKLYIVRERLLVTITILSKWVALNAYFVLLTALAVGVNMELKINLFIKGNLLIQMEILPKYALASLAASLQVFISQWILYIHRSTIEVKNNVEEADKQKNKIGEKSIASKIIIPIFVVIGFACFLIGIILKSIEFTVGGFAGDKMTNLDEKVHNYSAFEIGSKSKETVLNADFNYVIVQITYFIQAIFIPMLFFVAQICLYVFPMTLKMQKFLFNLSEIFFVSGTADVFLFALIGAYSQMGQFIQFMIGPGCDQLGIQNCFAIDIALEMQGTIPLIIGVVLMYLVGFYNILVTQPRIENQEEELGKIYAIKRHGLYEYLNDEKSE